MVWSCLIVTRCDVKQSAVTAHPQPPRPGALHCPVSCTSSLQLLDCLLRGRCLTPFQICFTQMVTLGLWATSVEMYAKRFCQPFGREDEPG
jgi:hypothetical protein